MSVRAKICGITDEAGLSAAHQGGAAFIGFVFVKTSKRYVTAAHAAQLLNSIRHRHCEEAEGRRGNPGDQRNPDTATWIATLPPAFAKPSAGKMVAHDDGLPLIVGLFVDPSDFELGEVLASVPLDFIQLHGHETPARVADVRALFGKPVIKAIGIAAAADFDDVPAYEAAADILLFDTKTGPAPSGGTGRVFDWSLLAGRSFAKPWMLAGGLSPDNVAAAIAATGAKIVDVSSGVETATPQGTKKDPEKIRAFLETTKSV